YTGTRLTISAGVALPSALAVDAQKNLIVLNSGGSGTATIYPPPYTTAGPVMLTLAPLPAALVLDANQNLWVSMKNNLYRYASPYALGNIDRLINTSLGAPLNGAQGLALDSTGRLYV